MRNEEGRNLNQVKRIIYSLMMNCRDNQEIYGGIYQVYQDLKNNCISKEDALEKAGSLAFKDVGNQEKV